MNIGLDGNEANVKVRVGSGQYAQAMLHQFAKVKNHNFTVYLKEKPLTSLPNETLNFKYKIFGPKKLWTQFALPLKLTFGSKLDLFFTLGHYGPRFSRIPYVITIFDLSYLHYPKLFKKDDLYQLTNWSKYSILNAKHIFAISKSTKNDIIQNYKIDSTKISVTYMGYNQKLFKPQPKSAIQKIKARYNIQGEYLVFVGTLQPRKNVERLIESFDQAIRQSGNQAIRDKKPAYPTTRPASPAKRGEQPDSLKLVIVGKKGWLYDSIFQKVKDLGLTNQVIFTGFVPDADLPPLLAGAKAYVLPSLWEGFGIPVVEAQACGTPVVVSNTSSLPEIVSSYPQDRKINDNAEVTGSGILVNPQSIDSIADGIKKVLTDPVQALDLSKKGVKNALRFSWQKCAWQTLKVLETINP